MFEGKELKDVFVFKKIYLTGESFMVDPGKNSGESMVESSLEFGITIGIKEENINTIAYKINTTYNQKIKEDIELGGRTYSKLDAEYISVFEISEETYAIEFKTLLDSKTEENSKNLSKISDFIIDNVYPYIKDHIEYIYKKADISIEIPLKF